MMILKICENSRAMERMLARAQEFKKLVYDWCVSVPFSKDVVDLKWAVSVFGLPQYKGILNQRISIFTLLLERKKEY